MRIKRVWLSTTLTLALAACSSLPANVPPQPGMTTPADGQIQPDGAPFHLLGLQALPTVAATADSSSSGDGPGNMIDGSLATQWQNGGYRAATAWAAVQLGQSTTLGSIAIKTGPSPAGTSYDVQVSSDGKRYTTVLANQTNTSWNLETKMLPAGTSGQWVRIFWHNSPSNPQAHFGIFALQVNGASGVPSPRPSGPVPAILSISQNPLDINDTGTLTALVSNPGKRQLSYRWSAKTGKFLTEGGAQSTYQIGSGGPNNIDDVGTLTITDPEGDTISKTFKIKTFVGTAFDDQATDAFQWDPRKTAYAALSGTVTIRASGYFSVYNAVICEYSTADGRRMALLKPGTTTLSGVTGNLYMYLLGPTGPNTPQPAIQLALSANWRTLKRTITQANIVGSTHVGEQIAIGPGETGYEVDTTTAKNGPYPYRTILEVWSNGLLEAPGFANSGNIFYQLHKPGDDLFGIDFRDASGDADDRLVLTDSLGGTGDNTGSWRIDHIVFGDLNATPSDQ